jgi:hypothetical protein
MCKVTLGIRECDRLDGASNLFLGSLVLSYLWRKQIFGACIKEIPEPTDPT